MIILPLSIVLHYCLNKTSDLTFIGFHNFWLQSNPMFVMMSIHAPSWYDDVRACALTFLYHIHYVNSYLRCHFHICGYDIVLSLRCAKSYPWTIYLYFLCISFPFYFVYTLWRQFFVPFPLSPRSILSCLLLSPRWTLLFLLLCPCWTWFIVGLA